MTVAPVEIALVGAGGRGYRAYGGYALAHPEDVRFVAVAEPDPARRKRFADLHGIPAERQFHSWEDLLERPRLAQAAVNATMDRVHHASTLGLLDAGYNVLLEKPMAPTAEQCIDLVRRAEQRGRILQICHVLRYAPFFRTIHDLVASGRLGDIISVQWSENLVFWHYAHSFVRGNWSNSSRSGPMLLTKSCHDLDLFVWMFGRPERVSSFGSLTHFCSDRVGPEIPERCTDGCPIAAECAYYAPRIYIEKDPGDWARDPVCLDHSPQALLSALQTGPYGRCVYRSDNDAVDHQVVLLNFPGGLNLNFTMQGASHVEGRTVRIDGERATLLANQSRNELRLHDHVTFTTDELRPADAQGGHGGGDHGVIREFAQALRSEDPRVLTSAADALVSHLLAFAAEEARLQHKVVDFSTYG